MIVPITKIGQDAVRLRGLFGGETERRCAEWVRSIEKEAETLLLARIMDGVATSGLAPADYMAINRLIAKVAK